MLPAQQGLGLVNTAVLQRHDGLVMHLQMAVVQSQTQIVGQAQMARDVFLHGRFKEAIAIAPVCFGGIHGLIGAFNQVRRFERILRVQCHANAGTEINHMPLRLIGVGQGGQDFVGHA